MKPPSMRPVKAFILVALALAIAAIGIYVADADDAPGAAVIGMLLMVVGVVLGVSAGRNRLSKRVTRTALAVGIVAAAFAAFLTHGSATNPASVNGELAGGMVMSLITRRDSGIVIAVTSNIAHANTSSLARRVADAFAEQTR